MVKVEDISLLCVIAYDVYDTLTKSKTFDKSFETISKRVYNDTSPGRHEYCMSLIYNTWETSISCDCFYQSLISKAMYSEDVTMHLIEILNDMKETSNMILSSYIVNIPFEKYPE